MRKLTELSTDSDFEEFSTILSKLHDSHAVITMKQAVQRKDGEYNYVDLQQTVTENRTTVQINGQFVFITLHNSRELHIFRQRKRYNFCADFQRVRGCSKTFERGFCRQQSRDS